MAETFTDLLKAHYRAIASRGGKARAKALSPERRSQIARKATRARWKKARARKHAA